jgi:hypothetical protein
MLESVIFLPSGDHPGLNSLSKGAKVSCVRFPPSASMTQMSLWGHGPQTLSTKGSSFRQVTSRAANSQSGVTFRTLPPSSASIV